MRTVHLKIKFVDRNFADNAIKGHGWQFVLVTSTELDRSVKSIRPDERKEH